ncbi:MAG: multicopper oxidase domain-containing protein [Paludibacter sp.]|nr:multicopper oxidase domain-containing protein [Paludibacter sp.]
MKRRNFTTFSLMMIFIMFATGIFAQSQSNFKRYDLKKQRNLNWATAPSIYPVAANITTQVPINPLIIPKFIDPLPHFAAGLRVNARMGENLIVKTVPHQQIALSTGTVLNSGTIGSVNPTVGLGNYWTYSISKDNGLTWTPALWPSFTIEAQKGVPLTVKYRNELYNQTYSGLNLPLDQGVHWAMPEMTPEPYSGAVPIVPHLHGGEVPSESDGGPYSWFTPGYAIKGPTWGIDGTDSVYNYPNTQEEATLWFHDHIMGATRLNVYAGLAGFYLLRGTDEENAHLPGWSGDDLVKEVAPSGKSGTFNQQPYLPEIELAIQDRMFDENGELYFPVEPTNPDLMYWGPEFFGNIITVNGKSWPYLSVAPRKYRFRFLDGCNARFLNMWLHDEINNTVGPKITVVGTDGGLLDMPIDLDPNILKASPVLSGFSPTGLFIAPGERFDVIIDFTGLEGKTLTLENDALIPYPSGDEVISDLDGHIMQFVVNGELVSAANHAQVGMDKSQIPNTLRANPIVRLTDFNTGLNLTPDVKRQLTLNESEGEYGPLEVMLNNSNYDNNSMMMPDPGSFGDVTEHPTEGTTEQVQIINFTMDAHPIHFHLVQFQLVSRQTFNAMAYDALYEVSFNGGMFKPSSGPPMDYNTPNNDGALGGNPAVSTFLTGSPRPPLPEERGWKDTYKVFPGEVTTFLIRYAPTNFPVNEPVENLKFGFDPSKGPGYVWHCHILDHEDNEMMRPFWVEPSPYRALQTCINSSEDFFQAPVGMSNYVWDIPAGGTLMNGGGTSDNFALVKWTTIGNKLVKVNYTNGIWKLSVPITFGLNVNTLTVTPEISNNNGLLTSNAAIGNQWLRSDTENGTGVELEFAVNHTYQPIQTGWYFTEVTVNGCSSNESNRINIISTGFSGSNKENEFNVYPSLSDGHFTASISIQGQETFDIAVFNSLGQKIFERNNVKVNNELKQEIDLRPIPSGVYSVLISNNSKQVVTKIFVVK